MAQRTVRAPFLGEFDRGAREVAVKFLQLSFEAAEERERIGGAAGEARDDFVVIDAASLARAVLDHAVAQSDLAVGGEHDLIVFAHAQYRSAMHLFAFVRYWHPTIIPRRCANGPLRQEGARMRSQAPHRHRDTEKSERMDIETTEQRPGGTEKTGEILRPDRGAGIRLPALAAS